MEIEAALSSFFGSSERSKGADLFRKDLVVISSASDTDVRAFVKGSSSCRVALAAEEVDAPAFTSTCSCPQGRKGDLCKHIWSVLLKLEETGADFLNGKVEAVEPGKKANPVDETRQLKQEEYKTQQREKVKARNKEIRQRKKREERGPRFTYPAPVQESLDFFAGHGFPLEDLDMASLMNARKLLSRVFHPDKGGSHEEVLEMNAHFDVLSGYLGQ